MRYRDKGPGMIIIETSTGFVWWPLLFQHANVAMTWNEAAVNASTCVLTLCCVSPVSVLDVRVSGREL